MSLNIDPNNWRLQTDGGIPYKLMEGSPHGRIGQNSAEIEEEVIIRASDLSAFVNECWYLAVEHSSGSVGYRKGRMCPGFSGLYCNDIQFEPFLPGKPVDPWSQDPGAPSGTYGEYFKLTLTYSALDQDDVSGDDPTAWLEVSSDVSAEIVAGGVSNSVWVTSELWLDQDANLYRPAGAQIGLKKANIGLSKISPQTEWSVDWKHVPRTVMNSLINRMRTYAGYINSSAMPLFNNAYPGTILFMGGTTRKEWTWMPEETQSPMTLSMKFSEKRIVDGSGIIKGHNYFWIPEAQRFELVLSGGQPSYQSANLNMLWT